MRGLLAGLLLTLGACTHVPAIQTMNADRVPAMEAECRSHFPRGRWQLVHTIHARLSGGRHATFTGVVVLSSVDQTIHCALMTLEGMVLFEAIDDGQGIRVSRAFGLFDTPHFAAGVMADIRFLFFAPNGSLVATGTTADNMRVCRYAGPRDSLVDLMAATHGQWRLQQYDGRGSVVRRVAASAVDSRGIASRMVIDAGSGRQAYRLSMTLVEALEIP